MLLIQMLKCLVVKLSVEFFDLIREVIRSWLSLHLLPCALPALFSETERLFMYNMLVKSVHVIFEIS